MTDDTYSVRTAGDLLRCGVVDIGSNTIRAVIYDVDVASRVFRETLNEKEHAELLGYIENGRLTDDGLEKLISVLDHMKNVCFETQCERVFYFATAALRDIANQSDVLFHVKAELGIDIDIIDGDEEARLDYLSLKEAT